METKIEGYPTEEFLEAGCLIALLVVLVLAWIVRQLAF